MSLPSRLEFAGIDLDLDLPGDGGDGTPVERDDHAGCDLDPSGVVADLVDDTVQAARRDDLVAGVDRVLHRLMLVTTALRRQNEEGPEADENHDQDQESAH